MKISRQVWWGASLLVGLVALSYAGMSRRESTSETPRVTEEEPAAAPAAAPAIAAKTERQESAGSVGRQAFIQDLAALMATSGLHLNFALGDPDTTIVIVARVCNETLLDALAKNAQAMAKVGFTKMSCGARGPDRGL